MTVTGFEQHDHHSCVASGLAAAQSICAEKGLNLTPVRRRTLELLLAEHRAMGAYDVLEHLRIEGLGAQPPVAYRALDFLVKHGFAHRVESLNAFVACLHCGETHSPFFLICRACSGVVEIPAQKVMSAAQDMASQQGFRIERASVEVEGLCAGCQEASV